MRHFGEDAGSYDDDDYDEDDGDDDVCMYMCVCVIIVVMTILPITLDPSRHHATPYPDSQPFLPLSPFTLQAPHTQPSQAPPCSSPYQPLTLLAFP